MQTLDPPIFVSSVPAVTHWPLYGQAKLRIGRLQLPTAVYHNPEWSCSIARAHARKCARSAPDRHTPCYPYMINDEAFASPPALAPDSTLYL